MNNKCEYCQKVKDVKVYDVEVNLCQDCLEALQTNWLEVNENDAHSLETR